MKLKKIISWLLPIALGIILAIGIQTYLVSFVRVDGSSMQPNLTNNERVLLLRKQPIKRFSVVVFDAYQVAPGVTKGSNFIKRVIAVPGDRIKYTKQGNLYINGKLVPQKFISKTQRTTETLANVAPNGFDLKTLSQQWRGYHGQKITTVPKNQYFVMGDNRTVSYDSRSWGLVPKVKIKGVAYAPGWTDHRKQINEAKN
ncbi:signal peptidase I [Lentilactobacillus senioris]|uniref:signal peptidase I n=1 Tax=Lentilactobacillus senioris TaxID=931534 RepID=UPI003D2AD10E